VKWIGQHIVDLIARFRGSVYFDNVENGTADTDKFLVIGSSGKLKYRTGTEVLSDIDALDTSYEGNTNLDTVGTITTGVWSGSSIGINRTDAKVEEIVGGDAITVSASTGSVIINADSATSSVRGSVEMATTLEATDGTDTLRAVTAAGLKSHVDARYAYQYIMFHASDVIKSNWITFGQNGLTNHTWGTDTSDDGVSVDVSTIACTNIMQVAAFKIPFACKLIGFYGTGHRYGGSNTFAAGVFILDSPDYNSEASGGAVDTLNATLRAYADAEDGGIANPFNQRLNKVVDTAKSYDCPAGSMIFPAFKDTAGVNSGSFRGNMTVILATPLITIS
jgi:hypothetical protein